jgi:hypothetical protein
MEHIEYEVVKTTKLKDAILSQNYVYNFKCENKDSSKHYVCNVSGCYASIILLDKIVIKVNGKLATDESELIHAKHDPYENEDIVKMEFKRTLKEKMGQENSRTLAALYLEEQSKLIDKTGDMELVAKSTPQLINIQAGLYKHKNKFIPAIPKTIEDINLEGKWCMCEDNTRKFVL